MARYRSIPTEIDAWQFKPFDKQPPPKWLAAEHVDEDTLVVVTNHGPAQVKVGDWVIRSPEGELYPCQDDVFRKKYELIS